MTHTSRPTSYLQITLTQPSLFNASCQARPGFDAALHVSDAGVVVESSQGFIHDGFSAVPRLRVSMCCQKSDDEDAQRHARVGGEFFAPCWRAVLVQSRENCARPRADAFG